MKKYLSMLLAMLQFALCAVGVSAAGEDYTKGLSFQNAEQHYTTSGTLSKTPQTFEATVYFPVDTPTNEEYGKTIIGNHMGSSTYLGVDFQIYNGKPRLVWINSSKTAATIEFDGVNVYKGEWVHIAVTALRSSTRDFKCYINGELVQTITSSYARYYWNEKPGFIGETTVGGNWRDGANSRYFKDGMIKNIAVYQDIRTADEIISDYTAAYNGGSVDYSEILIHYDFSDITAGTHPEIGGTIEDLSAVEGDTADDLVYDTWIDPEDMPERDPESYDFSLAVIGDIQSLNYFYYDETTGKNEPLSNLFDWVVENKDAKKIAGAFVLGDLTETGNHTTEGITPLPDNMEWKLAQKEVEKLKAAMPVSVVRGNHDTLKGYAEYFPYEDFKDGIDGCYIDTTDEPEVTVGYSDARDTYTDIENYQKSANLLNTYQKWRIGEQKYLILNLDVGAADDVLEWANGVCEAHPDYNVIVNTHGYLDGRTGDVILDTLAKYTSYWRIGVRNNGIDLWNKCFKKHKNISLILCGHYYAEKIIVNKKTGDHGNTVTTLLMDPQGLDAFGSSSAGGAYGMVAMLYFKDGGKTVDVEWYSTTRDKYLLQSCQFTEELTVLQSMRVSDVAFAGDSGSATIIGEAGNTAKNPTVSGETVSFAFAENERENQVEITTGVAGEDVSGISASVSLSGKMEGLVYAALYDKDGKMMGLKIKEPAASVSFAFEEPGSEVKVFWWKSAVNSLTPPAKITFNRA